VEERMIPVYKMLFNDTPDTPLSVEEKEQCITNVKDMNSIGHELIYVIIKSYENEIEGKQTLYPYFGKIQKSGLKFELESFPDKLAQMLFKFSQLHMSSQNER